MKLTSFTDYSLRVLIYLGIDAQRRATIAEIAQAFNVSENHLVKVVHFLGKQGWIDTVRGKGGGMLLGSGTGQMSLGDLVRATEVADLPAECFDPQSNACCITGVCHLQKALKRAVDAFYAVLDEYTLDDLVQNRGVLAKVLFANAPPYPG